MTNTTDVSAGEAMIDQSIGPIDRDLGENRHAVTANLLFVDGLNMRHDHKVDPSLVASIVAHGQLHDLIVREKDDDSGARYEIVDGGRRWMAIVDAIKGGLLPDDYRISVRVDNSATKEISVAANLHMAPHPLDVCEAIRELAKTAEDEDAIAAHFGQTRTWGWQRSKLAQLSDKAKKAYRDGRFDLAIAQQLTRLTEKQQDSLCKGKERIYENEIRNIIQNSGIDAKLALFDWQALYPKEKVQGSLFDDVTLLLDRNTFIQLQEQAVADIVKSYEEEGYSIVRLTKDDYNGAGKYVAFTGTPTEEQKKTLTILVQPKNDGLTWWFSKPSLLAKQAKKIEKKNGAQDTTDEPPKPMKASELVPVQTEILNAHIVADVRKRILEGDADEALMQWTVIAHVFGLKCGWTDSPGPATKHNGTDMRWGRLLKEHPGEFPEVVVEQGREPLVDLTWKIFAEMPKNDRAHCYRVAVAALCWVTQNVQDSHLITAKGSGVAWITPGEAFFKRYRTDQLLDYLKRSGVRKSDGGMPIDSKKSTAVEVAVVKAGTEDGWQFGIDKVK